MTLTPIEPGSRPEPAARSAGATTVLVAGFGVAFGVALGMIGFADFGELNAMFTFQDPRMLAAFAGAVVVAAVGHRLLGDRPTARRSVHRGVVPGAVCFGVGWAVSGGCPSIPLVQVGAGYLPALVSLAGIVVGMRLHRVVNGRWLRIDSGSCEH